MITNTIVYLSFRGSNEGGILYRTLDNVPISDQHLALGIYLELAFQRGSLSHILESVLLLLRLWDRGQDNEKNSSCTTAPLNPLLKRLQRLSEYKFRLATPMEPREVCILYFSMRFFSRVVRMYCMTVVDNYTGCIKKG